MITSKDNWLQKHMERAMRSVQISYVKNINKILLANRNKLPRFNLEKLNHVEGYNFNTLPGYKEAKEAAGRMFSAKLK